MFTGIIRAVGRTVARGPSGDGVRLAVRIETGALPAIAPGDSVAVSGCCLTVIGVRDGVLEFDASAETLARTTGFPLSQTVNLEPALRLSDRLDGHLVSGHVDGTGSVTAFREVTGSGDPSTKGEASRYLEIEAPAPLARYVAPKGSIAVDGVSLTTNTVDGAAGGRVRFTVNLIPYTLAATTLGSLCAGAAVNLEVDLLARYVDRMREADRAKSEPGG